MTSIDYPKTDRTRQEQVIVLVLPLLVVFFLFFLDEGYSDLRWMEKPGNWIVFGLYWMGMILGEFIISLILPAGWSARTKMNVILGAGIPLGVLLVLLFLTSVSGFLY